MDRNHLQKALTRERAKLTRQTEAVKATEALIESLEQLLKTSK